jgi:hypothetical protein
MGAFDRLKNKAEELREKSKPLAGTLKDKAERATETIKAKANEFGDRPPPGVAGGPATEPPAAPEGPTDSSEGGPVQPGV